MPTGAEREVHLNIALSRFREPQDVAAEVAAAVRELAPDLLHSHHLATDILGQRAAEEVSSGCIIRHVHGILQRSSEDPLADKVVRYEWNSTEIAMELDIEKSVSLTLCPSRELLEKLTRYGIPAEKLVHLPNAIDFTSFSPGTPDFRRRARRRFGVREAEYVVGFLGRLEPCKNPEMLLRLAQAQAARTIRPKYLVMGSGPLDRQLRREAEAQGIADAFSWHPASTHVREFYAAIDVLILPSRTEGHPFTLLEAMASGVPAIAAAVGGIAETIVDEEDGLLFDVDDLPKVLAMIDRLADPGERAGLARWARRRAATEFDNVHHQARLLDLYGQAMGQSNA